MQLEFYITNSSCHQVGMHPGHQLLLWAVAQGIFETEFKYQKDFGCWLKVPALLGNDGASKGLKSAFPTKSEHWWLQQGPQKYSGAGNRFYKYIALPCQCFPPLRGSILGGCGG
jgi:hypothetical protein